MTRRETRPGVKPKAGPTDPLAADQTKHNGDGQPSPRSAVSNLLVKRERLDWKNDVLPVAKTIVESYDTPVTLRQLLYRLVSLKEGERGRIPNTKSAYEQLSVNTAEARRNGTFPDLIDQRRGIVEPSSWNSPQEGTEALRDCYRRDRTEGQEYQIYLGVEKAGLVNQLDDWFAHLGLPILPLGGQCSQSFVDQITRRVNADGRPAVLLYAGDHDPTGWSILQNFVDRTGFWVNEELRDFDTSTMPEDLGRKRGHARAWKRIPNWDRYRRYRVALTPEQCVEYDLARNAAKAKDPSLDTFLINFGYTLTDNEIDDGLGVQVEVDALDPSDFRRLFTDAIGQYWDADAYQAVLAQEEADRAELDAIVDRLDQ